MKRTRGGSLDLRKIGDSLRMAGGLDIRHWVSLGTVGTVDDSGVFDPTDTRAVVIAPDGVYVDVLLMPCMLPVTCRVQFGVGGAAHIQAPIHPGDEVVAVLPDGDAMTAPIVVAVLSSMSAKAPMWTDRKPIARNDRLLVHMGKGQPIEIHAAKVQLGDQTANEPVPLGNTYSTEITVLVDALAADDRPSPLGPIKPSPGLLQAITAFKANLPTQLSDFVFTQKLPPTT